MSAVVLVEVHIKPESVADFQAFMDDILPDTRTYEGCVKVEVNQNQDEIGNFVLYEIWESKAHHEKYLGWRMETGFLDQLGPMLTEPPSIRYYDVTNRE